MALHYYAFICNDKKVFSCNTHYSELNFWTVSLTYFSSVKQLLSSMKMKSLNSSLTRQITSKTNSAARGPVCFCPITHFCWRWSTAATAFSFIVFLSCVLCRPLRPRSEDAPWRTLISSRHRCRLSSAEMEKLGAVMFSLVTYRRFTPWQWWKMYTNYYVKY